MMDSRRLAYLDAMGIDVWQPRGTDIAEEPGAAEPCVVVGAGDGDILCVVRSEAEAQLKLASAIGAAMRCQPIWSWPAADAVQAGEGVSVKNLVSEKMLTRILIFGEELAEDVLGADKPEVLSTARVHQVPGLDRIASDQDAKRLLWRLMNEHGIAANRSGGR